MPRGRGRNTRTGVILNGWLRNVGEGTSTQFREYIDNLTKIGYSTGNAQTMRTFFWVVKARLGLIEVLKIETTEKNHREYHYRIRPGYASDMAWMDVFKFAYPDDYSNNSVQKIYWKIRESLNGASVTPIMFGEMRSRFA